MTRVLLRGNLDTDVCVHRERTVGSHREKTAVYKPRREPSGKNNPANTLIPDFSLQDCEEMRICCLSPQSVVLCHGSPSRLRHSDVSLLGKYGSLGDCACSVGLFWKL